LSPPADFLFTAIFGSIYLFLKFIARIMPDLSEPQQVFAVLGCQHSVTAAINPAPLLH
jgi:hypothetical protein